MGMCYLQKGCGAQNGQPWHEDAGGQKAEMSRVIKRGAGYGNAVRFPSGTKWEGASAASWTTLRLSAVWAKR